MKRIILIPALLLSMAASALPDGWVVTVFNQAYNDLSSPIVVPLAPGWDDPEVKIPLGFTYNLFGLSTDTMYIDSNLSIGSQVSTSLINSNSNFHIFSFFIDIMDRATYPTNPPSTISYETLGASGNKISKVQWANFGFYGEDDIAGTLDDSANVQMWFYETDGSFEFRFGPSYLDDFERNIESTKMPIEFGKDVNIGSSSVDWVYYLSSLTPPAVDSFNFATFPTLDYGFNDYPKDSTVIRFSPTYPVGTADRIKLNDQITFYPSLATSVVNVDFTSDVLGDAFVRIIDMSGKPVLQQQVSNTKNQIDINSLASSYYILQVQYEGRNVFYKFTKE